MNTGSEPQKDARKKCKVLRHHRPSDNEKGLSCWHTLLSAETRLRAYLTARGHSRNTREQRPRGRERLHVITPPGSADATTGGSTPADATETATICHLAGTLTASECAGDWFYAADGERWPFRLAVLDERDTGVDERTLLLRGSFEHAGGIADDDLELTICNNDVSGSGSSRFGAYTVVGTVHGDSIQIRKLKNVLPKNGGAGRRRKWRRTRRAN